MIRLAIVVSATAAWAACTPTQVRYEASPSSASASSPVDATLFLVGDAGEVNPERADVLAHLTAQIQDAARTPERPVLVAFLGDNIYDRGLPAEPSREDLQKLDGQVLALGDLPSVSGVFLPGNHDWANGASVTDGRAAVERQSAWIEEVRPGRDIRFLPADGCPGPVGRELGPSAYVVFIDTEWLLRRPGGIL